MSFFRSLSKSRRQDVIVAAIGLPSLCLSKFIA